MIIENTPLSYLVQFDSGTPLGVFTYSLYDDEGNPVASIHNVEVAPDVGAVSILIQIPTTGNTLTKPLFEGRTISWFYTTSLGAVNGSYSYIVEKKIPFPATPEGVRTKLGVDITELPDDRIDLLGAYVQYNAQFEDGLDAYTLTGDSTALKITGAIEAVAALQVLPSLQISLAKRLTSGTNEYERFSKIDWELLAGNLQAIIDETSVLIDPTLVYESLALFTLAIRPDPFTGES